MPDILMTVLNGANKRLKDMGDGTVAEVVYNANSTAMSGNGTVAVSNFPPVQAVTDTNIGSLSDAAATSDTGTFSLIGLTKRLLTKIPGLGAQTMANSLPVSIATDQVIPVSPQVQTISGTLNALNTSIALTLNGTNGAIIDLRGSFVASLAFQGTVDGINWFSLVAMPVASASNTTLVSSATVPGAWHLLTAGLQQIRVLVTAFTSGVINVNIRANQAQPFLYTAVTGATNAVSVASGTINSATLAASSNLIGDLGIQYRSNNVGAASSAPLMSPSVVTAQTIKATSGRLIGLIVQNSATSLRSLKLFNASSVTLGTTAALFEIDIPAGGSLAFNFEGGLGFSTAISCAVTCGKGLTDITATGLAPNDVSGVLAFS